MKQATSYLRLPLGTEQAPGSVLHVYPAEQPAGKAIIMCPGGGFRQVALTHEGTDMAPWFTQRGITFAVLEYRLPEGHTERPFEDICAAMQALRQHTEESCTHIGVMGASIGGHIAAQAAERLTDALRPDFQILLYPVISMTDGLTHTPSRERLMGADATAALKLRYSLEQHAHEGMPPAFIAAAQDDAAVSPRNALAYYEALTACGVPTTLHLYPDGGHSFAFAPTFAHKALLQRELEEFLNAL